MDARFRGHDGGCEHDEVGGHDENCNHDGMCQKSPPPQSPRSQKEDGSANNFSFKKREKQVRI